MCQVKYKFKTISKIFTVLFLVGAVLIPSKANAAEVDLYGAKVTWNDKLYQTDGCSNYDFNWYNGVGRRLLSFEISIVDAYGRRLGDASKIGVEAGTSGVFNVFICESSFKTGLGPYTLKVYIEDYTGGFGSRQTTKDFYFSQIPGTSSSSTPVPLPNPTVTVTKTPAPAPTVTVTATPAPAPTVTVTATPESDNFYKSEAVRLQTELITLQIKYDSLNTKIKKICSIKPKPKNC